MIQGKIERWHQTVKNRILLENYYLPGDLENQIETFVADYNNCRYHESIDNLIPAPLAMPREGRCECNSGPVRRKDRAGRHHASFPTD